jgi:hypothetical protein
VFYPAPKGLLPLDWKRHLFDRLSAEIKGQMKTRCKRGGSRLTLNRGEKRAVKLAADANALRSALIGGHAARSFVIPELMKL